MFPSAPKLLFYLYNFWGYLRVEMPNRYIDSWQPTDLSKLDWQAYPALFMPKENTGMLHQLADMLQGFGGSTGNKMDYSRFTDGMPKTELVVLNIELRFFDVSIPLQGLALNKTTPQINRREVKKETKIASELLIKYNALDRILLRILTSNRAISAKPIFKILASESKTEEELRTFDTEFILLDQIDDVIIWKDVLSKKQEKRCSLSTLANKLSDIRKDLDQAVKIYEKAGNRE